MQKHINIAGSDVWAVSAIFQNFPVETLHLMCIFNFCITLVYMSIYLEIAWEVGSSFVTHLESKFLAIQTLFSGSLQFKAGAKFRFVDIVNL